MLHFLYVFLLQLLLPLVLLMLLLLLLLLWLLFFFFKIHPVEFKDFTRLDIICFLLQVVLTLLDVSNVKNWFVGMRCLKGWVLCYTFVTFHISHFIPRIQSFVYLLKLLLIGEVRRTDRLLLAMWATTGTTQQASGF